MLAVAYAPDSATLATGGDDRTVRVWDARSGDHVRTLTGHTSGVLAVAYAPDSATLATGSDDGTVRVWNPRTGRQVAGTGFGTATRRMLRLAGVRSDQPSVVDQLGFADDVEALATLVAAADTEAPLAIAVLGEWGSGKSSFLRQMQDQVAQLADLSANNLGLSSFSATVRQVRFNAWHYSDERLWSGLVEHLFRELAADRSEDQPAVTATDVLDLRRSLRSELEGLRAQDAQLTTRLTRSAARRPAGALRRLGFAPWTLVQLAWAAWRQSVRDVRAGLWVLLGWAVTATVAYTAWHFFHAAGASVVAGTGGVLSPLLVAAVRLRAWHRGAQRAGQWIQARLEQRRREIRDDIAARTARLAEVDAAARLATFLNERTRDGAYGEYRGLLGQVHRDLRQLDTELRAARAEWAASATSNQPPPLERIILYIDDLDRCPPQRVVEVLAAVHLMLALSLFIVVVAVDPRWLLGALHHHYRELFDISSYQDGGELATPLDYLDKIFQIPYSVRPMTKAASATYLPGLLRPSTQPPTRTQGAQTDDKIQPDRANTDTLIHAPNGTDEASGHQPTPTGAPRATEPTSTDDTTPKPHTSDDTHLTASGSHLYPSRDPRQTAIPDLRASELQFSDDEIRSLARLGDLLPTPRAAKKLANLYRLIRIGIQDPDPGAYLTEGTYQVVQLLLALIVGAPAAARVIFTAVLTADPSGTLSDLIGTNHAAGIPTEDWARTSSIRRQVQEILAGSSAPVDLAIYQRWCPTIARYSFHTRDLVDPLKKT